MSQNYLEILPEAVEPQSPGLLLTTSSSPFSALAANTQYLSWSLRVAAASTVVTVSGEGLGAGGRTGYGRGLPGSETGLTHQGLLKTKTKKKKRHQFSSSFWFVSFR